ncbi:MAG: PAS domain S-box protein [Candidatus Magnetoovum sp. WYHC-5]|nr:PAS domain S-box protein [Candidatus Magnetoovum sp. WYHC-5]
MKETKNDNYNKDYTDELSTLRSGLAKLKELELSRKNQEEALNRRLTMEGLVADISSSFIRAHVGEVDKHIFSALKEVGLFLGVDRCYLYLVEGSDFVINKEYEWHSNHVKPRQGILVGTALRRYRWIMQRLGNFEHLYVPVMDELKAEAADEKAIWTALGIKSLLAIPLILNNEFIGFFGFNVETSLNVCNEGDISLLRLVGDIFSAAIERKRADKALQEQSERLENVLEASGEGFGDWDITSGTVYYSHNFIKMLGFTPAEFEMTLSAWERLLHPEDRGSALKSLDDNLKGLTPSYEFEYRLMTKDGVWKWFISKGSVVRRDESGAPLRVCGTVCDISDRKEMENALRKKEMQYDMLLNNMLSGYILCEVVDNCKEYRIAAINAKALDLLHLESLWLINKPFTEVMPDGLKPWVEYFERVLLVGKPLNLEATYSALKSVYELFVYCPQKGYVALIFNDITERRKKDEEFRAFIKIEEIVSKIASLADGTDNVQVFLNSMVHLIAEHTSYNSCGFYLVDSISGRAECCCHAGVEEGFLTAFNNIYIEKEPYCGVFINKEPYICWDVERQWPQLWSATGFVSFVLMPVLADSKVIGAFFAGTHKERRLMERQVEFLYLVGISRETSWAIARIKAQDAISQHLAALQKCSVYYDENIRILNDKLGAESFRRTQLEAEITKKDMLYGNIYQNTAIMEVYVRDAIKEVLRLKGTGVSELAYFFNQNPDYIRYLAEVIYISNVNDEALKIFEATDKGQILGPLINIFTEKSFNDFKEAVIAFFGNKKFFKKVVFNKTIAGKEIKLLYNVLFPENYNNITTLLISMMDISDLVKDEALKESEERYKKLIEAVTDYVYTVYVSDGKVVSTVHGPGCLAITGYTYYEYDIYPYLWYTMIYEDDRQYVLEQSNKVLLGISIPAIEHRIIHKNGSIRWVSNKPIPRFNENREVIAYDGLVSDITERKYAQLMLEAERDKFQKYLNISGVIFVLIGKDEKVKLINKKGCDILGFNEDEIVGQNWFDMFLPNDNRSTVKSVFHAILAEKITDYEYYENSVVVRDGKLKYISWHNTVLRDEWGNITDILSSGEDITERKQLEFQLYQSQKMEAIGKLAGGVAHDFNNILSAISNYIFLLQKYIVGNSTAVNYVEQIMASLDRASNLTKSLLAFSRKQIIDPKPIDIVHLINNIGKFLNRIIGEHIELQTHCTADSIIVKADRTQIEMVLINLATNARDAMPDGGTLLISVDCIFMDEGFIKSHKYGSIGKYAMISVSDTGHGMPREVKDKVFEPFFTTKEVGKGTGLGLATAYGIIKQHNGFINLYSELGVGTNFNIYLPLSEEAPDNLLLIPQNIYERGVETILVAEDDERLRLAVSNVLKDAGYNVVEAKDGHHAVSQFAMFMDSIDLAIIDVVMPGLDGKHVADELSKLKNGLKILFTSGYTYDIIHHRGILNGEINYISKPFHPTLFLQKIRDILKQ